MDRTFYEATSLLRRVASCLLLSLLVTDEGRRYTLHIFFYDMNITNVGISGNDIT